ncbi:MAG: HD-GYP domain-containing protein [Bacillota bacterium]
MINNSRVQFDISLINMVMGLSDTLDLISPLVNGHHKRVAYIASSIAREYGLSASKQRELIIAGSLHDIGAFSFQERLNNLNFERKFVDNTNLSNHSELGYRLIKGFKFFDHVAPFIRYHHFDWQQGLGSEYRRRKVPEESHILHLADRIDVLIDQDSEILGQVDQIKTKIQQYKGSKFKPELVDAFLSLADKEIFWFEVIAKAKKRILFARAEGINMSLSLRELQELAKLFSQIIDFRSRFTAAHSSGVATVAQLLGEYAGLSQSDRELIKVAGYLHDLGKVAIPTEILEKETQLTEKEYNIIKRHAYYTYRILDKIGGLGKIQRWATCHHERLNGAGYPFHHQGSSLSLGSRIIAVADVFTAIREDRPYRAGMKRQQAVRVLESMSDESALDSDLVGLLINNYDKIDNFRQIVQNEETQEYQKFVQSSIAS